MTSLMSTYGTLVRASRPLLERLLRKRLEAGKEDPARIGERIGIPGLERPEGKLVWIHAASVGEAQSALILIEALKARMPQAFIMVTTGTMTSAAMMKKRLSGKSFHQFVPLDHPHWVKRFLDHWRPDIAFWMESELWPTLLSEIKIRKIPAALINARLSEKSYRYWKLGRGLVQEMLSAFDVVCAQTERDAGRFRALGARFVSVTDNLKFSATPLPYDGAELERLQRAFVGRPLWVYASTHPGEEVLAARVHRALVQDYPGLLTIIVPRHPARGAEVQKIVEDAHCQAQLRGTALKLPEITDDIYIADTLGELGLFYRLAPVAMIGRSFSADGGGGHNPVEAAQLGSAVLTGPHVQFQQDIFDAMLEAGAALQVHHEKDFINTMKVLLSGGDVLQTLKNRGYSFAQSKSHVLDHVMKAIEPLLKEREAL